MKFKVIAGLVAIGAVSFVSSFFEKLPSNTATEKTEEYKELLLAPIEKVEHNYVQGSFGTVGLSGIKIEIEKETEAEVQTEAETETETQTETQTEAQTEAETVPQRVVACSDEDYYNLLRIVEAEATGGDVTSKMLVANVIINRVNSQRFPGTITEVIFQGNGEQFQPIADGRFYTVNVTASTIEAVERALCGENNAQGAYFFAATASVNAGGWHSRCLTRLFEYGGHVYFTF